MSELTYCIHNLIKDTITKELKRRYGDTIDLLAKSMIDRMDADIRGVINSEFKCLENSGLKPTFYEGCCYDEFYENYGECKDNKCNETDCGNKTNCDDKTDCDIKTNQNNNNSILSDVIDRKRAPPRIFQKCSQLIQPNDVNCKNTSQDCHVLGSKSSNLEESLSNINEFESLSPANTYDLERTADPRVEDHYKQICHESSIEGVMSLERGDIIKNKQLVYHIMNDKSKDTSFLAVDMNLPPVVNILNDATDAKSVENSLNRARLLSILHNQNQINIITNQLKESTVS